MASNKVGEAYFELGVKDDKLKQGLDKSKKSASDFEKEISKSSTTISGALGGIGLASLAMGASFVALGKGILSAAEAAGFQEREFVKLSQIIRSTGGAAGVTSRDAVTLAASLQELTEFGDETIMGAEQLMLTFTKVSKEVFPEAIETVLDMSTVLGQDLKSSAIQLGKALNDPIQGVSALRRVGVQLSDQQEKQVKSFVEQNDIISAQKVILGELNTQMGGAARAAADTYLGRVKQMKNAFGDLNEMIGSFFTPTLKRAAESMTKGFEGATKVLKTIQLAYIDTVYWINEQSMKIYSKSSREYNILIHQNMDLLKRKLVLEGIDPNTMKPISKKAAGPSSEASEEGIKKQIAALKALQAIQTDHEKKILGLSSQRLQQSYIDELSTYQKINEMRKDSGVRGEELAQKARLEVAKYYAQQRKQIEIANAKEIANAALSLVGGYTNQLGAIFAQYAQNQSMALDEEQKKRQDALDIWYNEQVSVLENTTMSEKKRAKALEALDKEKARRDEKLQKDIDKKKRKIQRESAIRQRDVDIINATTTGIQAAMNSYAWGAKIGGPILGGVMAGISGMFAAVQIALLASQPIPSLAEGGFAAARSGGIPMIFAEGRYDEAVIPLNDEIFDRFGRGIIKSLESSIVPTRGTDTVELYRVAPIDRNVFFEELFHASQNGELFIAKRAVV